MQNDFIDGPLGTPEARAIVDNVCAKIREGEWDGIFHTKDTHHDYNYLDTQEGKNLPIPHCIYRKNGWYYTEKVMEALLSKSFMVEKSTFGATLLVDKLRELIYDGKLTVDIELTHEWDIYYDNRIHVECVYDGILELATKYGQLSVENYKKYLNKYVMMGNELSIRYIDMYKGWLLEDIQKAKIARYRGGYRLVLSEPISLY